MTEKQPNSQSNNDEQKQQETAPAKSSASSVQPDSVTSAAKPAETSASSAQADDKKAEEVKSAASPASSAQPDSSQQSGDKKAEEVKSAASPAPPAQPASSQQSGDKKAEEVKSAASPVPPAKPESAATSTDEDETLASKPAVPAQPPKPEQESSGSGTNKIPGDVIAAVKRGPEPVPASPPPTAPIPPKSPSASDAASAAVDAPKKPTASQACPNCGHNNRAGVIFCENCGTNLVTGKQPTLGTRDLVKDQEEEAARPLDTKESQAIKSAGSGTFTDDMVLRIEIEGGLTPMLVYPKVEIIFGRRDPSSGNQPDVDMTGYAGYRMGVSRRHAALRLHDNRLDVSDLGSSNGTFLNGQRLDAHQPYQVRDGDEIRLGQMVLKLFFQAGKS